MFKNERGITLLILIITVLIMTILAGVAIRQGSASYTEVKLQNFSYELQQIQGRVDTIYEKIIMQDKPNYVKYDGKILGADMKTSVSANKARATLVDVKGEGYNYDSAPTSSKTLFYNEEGSSIYQTYYRYFSKSALESQLDIKNPGQDVIINFKTREVISVEGIIYNDLTYHTLDEMK